MCVVYIITLAIVASCCAQEPLPAVLPQVTIEGTDIGTCPDANGERNSTKSAIKSLLREVVIPELAQRYSNQPQCPCGGPGNWRRIAHLNMSNSDHQCPSSWRLITTPVRGCGRLLGAPQTCDSTIFPAYNRSYSRVCGRVNAYQKASPDAFHPSIARNPGIEGEYIDGVSLTYGATGSRQHIWSFAAAVYETSGNFAAYAACSCTNSDFNWPYQVPSFIGNNYFCDTGNRGPGWRSVVYDDDPMWDGEGCGPKSTCCQLNNPPWFCTTLPEPTTEDIEMRVCHDQGSGDEDLIVSLVDIHVM